MIEAVRNRSDQMMRKPLWTLTESYEVSKEVGERMRRSGVRPSTNFYTKMTEKEQKQRSLVRKARMKVLEKRKKAFLERNKHKIACQDSEGK